MPPLAANGNWLASRSALLAVRGWQSCTSEQCPFEIDGDLVRRNQWHTCGLFTSVRGQVLLFLVVIEAQVSAPGLRREDAMGVGDAVDLRFGGRKGGRREWHEVKA